MSKTVKEILADVEKVSDDVKRAPYMNWGGIPYEIIEYNFWIGQKKGILDAIKSFRAMLEDRIDHYTPYRPITDSPEAKEIRELLIKLQAQLPEEKE